VGIGDDLLLDAEHPLWVRLASGHVVREAHPVQEHNPQLRSRRGMKGRPKSAGGGGGRWVQPLRDGTAGGAGEPGPALVTGGNGPPGLGCGGVASGAQSSCTEGAVGRADPNGNNPEPQIDRRTIGDGQLDPRFQPARGKAKGKV
jgi:hypothetical protein